MDVQRQRGEVEARCKWCYGIRKGAGCFKRERVEHAFGDEVENEESVAHNCVEIIRAARSTDSAGGEQLPVQSHGYVELIFRSGA